jgi:hypothetical protein
MMRYNNGKDRSAGPVQVKSSRINILHLEYGRGKFHFCLISN